MVLKNTCMPFLTDLCEVMATPTVLIGSYSSRAGSWVFDLLLSDCPQPFCQLSILCLLAWGCNLAVIQIWTRLAY